jgi:pyridoxal 5'-phosphate synthase subunit Pdx1
VLWVRLPEGVSGRALAAAAREEGVLLSAGADYQPDQSDVPAIRISVARGSAGDLEKALGSRAPARATSPARPRGRRRAARRPPGTRATPRKRPHPDLKTKGKPMTTPVFSSPFSSDAFRVKVGLAEMLKGGVIMDVVNAEQAKVAEDAGAAAVMALERVPADIRRDGGVARMSPVSKIREIEAAVSIPVMAKCRIGHLAEARVLEALGVDFIDESEVLTPADEENHVYKHDYKVPFVCGCRNLGEALRRIGEGAAMIRTKGEAGTGDIVHAVKHLREVTRQMKALTLLTKDELDGGREEPRGAVRSRRRVAQQGPAPGAELRGRRHRDARGRGALPDARRRGGLRRAPGSSSPTIPRSARARSSRRRRTSRTRTASRRPPRTSARA